MEAIAQVSFLEAEASPETIAGLPTGFGLESCLTPLLSFHSL